MRKLALFEPWGSSFSLTENLILFPFLPLVPIIEGRPINWYDPGNEPSRENGEVLSSYMCPIRGSLIILSNILISNVAIWTITCHEMGSKQMNSFKKNCDYNDTFHVWHEWQSEQTTSLLYSNWSRCFLRQTFVNVFLARI